MEIGNCLLPDVEHNMGFWPWCTCCNILNPGNLVRIDANSDGIFNTSVTWQRSHATRKAFDFVTDATGDNNASFEELKLNHQSNSITMTPIKVIDYKGFMIVITVYGQSSTASSFLSIQKVAYNGNTLGGVVINISGLDNNLQSIVLSTTRTFAFWDDDNNICGLIYDSVDSVPSDSQVIGGSIPVYGFNKLTIDIENESVVNISTALYAFNRAGFVVQNSDSIFFTVKNDILWNTSAINLSGLPIFSPLVEGYTSFNRLNFQILDSSLMENINIFPYQPIINSQFAHSQNPNLFFYVNSQGESYNYNLSDDSISEYDYFNGRYFGNDGLFYDYLDTDASNSYREFVLKYENGSSVVENSYESYNGFEFLKEPNNNLDFFRTEEFIQQQYAGIPYGEINQNVFYAETLSGFNNLWPRSVFDFFSTQNSIIFPTQTNTVDDTELISNSSKPLSCPPILKGSGLIFSVRGVEPGADFTFAQLVNPALI
jgi:hypothetical protein